MTSPPTSQDSRQHGQRSLDDAARERQAEESRLQRQASTEQWRRQRDAVESRRHAEDQLRTAQRAEHDEQVRLRHLAEDEERRRRKVLDLAQRRERIAAYRARVDPARRADLASAQAETEQAERRWREADEHRRRWPSRWPW